MTNGCVRLLSGVWVYECMGRILSHCSGVVPVGRVVGTSCRLQATLRSHTHAVQSKCVRHMHTAHTSLQSVYTHSPHYLHTSMTPALCECASYTVGTLYTYTLSDARVRTFTRHVGITSPDIMRWNVPAFHISRIYFCGLKRGIARLLFLTL